jgi:hypothetical protein
MMIDSSKWLFLHICLVLMFGFFALKSKNRFNREINIFAVIMVIILYLLGVIIPETRLIF